MVLRYRGALPEEILGRPSNLSKDNLASRTDAENLALLEVKPASLAPFGARAQYGDSSAQRTIPYLQCLMNYAYYTTISPCLSIA